MNPLLSIAVPTKNRYEYLKWLIELFVSIATEEMELVIQDNSDSLSDIREFIDKKNDKRIRYFFVPGYLSVVDNCDRAIENSRGEFISMIGDDDGFHRDIINCAKYMKAHSIDSIIGRRAYYNWPGTSGVIFDYSAKLRLPKYSGKLKKIDSKKNLQKMLKTSNFEYLDKLPAVYNGIVSRACLEKIKQQTGSYFPGPSPDMANSVALSLIDINHYTYDFPFSIAGKCATSAGGRGAKHQHLSKIEDASHLPSNTSERWHSKIPKYWSAPTIYAQSAVDACKRMNHDDLANKFNFDRLMGVIFSSNKTVYRLGKESGIRPNFFSMLKGAQTMFFQRLSSFVKNMCIKHNFSSTKMIENVENIIECEEILQSSVKSHL